MALVLADRVQEYSTTTGTGTLTLSGAYAGFQTFAAGIGNGNTCYYTITSDKNQWEVGIGTVGIGTLARTTLISSSTGSTIDFQGTLTVFVTLPAEEAVYGDSTTIVAPAGALLPVASGGTGASTAAAARTALELGTIATQNANAIAVTGGAINGTTVGATTVAAGSFSTLNSSGNTRLGGLSGNQSLQVNNVASAVNYAQVVGAVTGGTPVFTAQGADANIGLTFQAKGTSGVIFAGNGQQIFTGINVNGTDFTNYYNTTGSLNYTAAGGSSNINFYFGAKGTGSIQLASGGGTQAVVSNTASAVNYLNLTGSATNGGTPANAAPTISAQGSDANINLNLTPKGLGTVNSGASSFATTGVYIGSSLNFIYQSSANTLQFRVGTTPAYMGFVDNSGAMGISSGNPILFTGTGGTTFRIANSAVSSVNYVQVDSATTTNAPTVSAQGSDANINIKLTPKGTGVLQFGTYTAGILAQAGYITITDAGGTSRRLLVG